MRWDDSGSGWNAIATKERQSSERWEVMATNNEIAAFEGFKFNVGDVVRSIVERVQSDTILKQGQAYDMETVTMPVIGMVLARSLMQGETGISRFYVVSGPNCYGAFREMELEALTVQ